MTVDPKVPSAMIATRSWRYRPPRCPSPHRPGGGESRSLCHLPPAPAPCAPTANSPPTLSPPTTTTVGSATSRLQHHRLRTDGGGPQPSRVAPIAQLPTSQPIARPPIANHPAANQPITATGQPARQPSPSSSPSASAHSPSSAPPWSKLLPVPQRTHHLTARSLGAVG